MCHFYFPYCDWTKLWEKIPANVLGLSIVSGIKEPVRIK